VVVYLVGIMAEFSNNGGYLVTGLILLTGVFLPLVLVDRRRQQRRIRQIIESYKGKISEKKEEDETRSGEQSNAKGWNMNTSPFRERKGGLTWGGGNIKGANATRGTRRSFLK